MIEQVELWGSMLEPHSRKHFNMFYKGFFKLFLQEGVIGELGEDIHIESSTYFEVRITAGQHKQFKTRRVQRQCQGLQSRHGELLRELRRNKGTRFYPDRGKFWKTEIRL
jgi:hypothetical protein